ncbi:MAG: prolyl oligopeptidase family serine peptidase [Anaerolineae bacterium]
MTQQARTFEIVRTIRLNYLLFLPDDYQARPDETWPLILFLHGAGERGDDLDLVKLHGIAKIVDQRRDFPFIAVSPQCPAGSWWWRELEALTGLLDEVVSSLAVDRSRIYLTGMSMGGYGTWHLAAMHPDRFAAIAPICGGGLPYDGFPERVCALKDVPVWAFHGAQDPVVPLKESKSMVEALRACGGDVRFTVYPDAGHDSWTQAYDTPELYTWFRGHSR